MAKHCVVTAIIELPTTVTLDDSAVFVLFNDALAKAYGANTRIVTMTLEEG
jgi:hypothetical protein